MRLRLAVLTILAFTAFACSNAAEPYTHVPKYSKNVSTLYGHEAQNPQGMAPDIEWRDSNGVKRTLRDLRGKVVVVNFWATWCVPCLVELPALADIANDFRDDSVVVLGMSIDQAGNVFPKVEEFHRSKGLNFQVITDNKMDVYKAYTRTSQVAIPQTFFVDVDGFVQSRLVGEQQYDSFKEQIEALL